MLRQGTKLRPIDDGRSAGHNSASAATETIYTTTPDCVVAAARSLLQGLRAQAEDQETWSAPVFGTNDMRAAYRQLPNRPQELPGLAIAYWDPEAKAVRYVLLRAHPFGLASAVLNFNRIPALGTAALRRMCGVCCTHFFDDVGTLDTVGARGSGQGCVHTLYTLMGIVLDDAKEQSMAFQRIFLGVLLDLARAQTHAVIKVDVKPGLREALWQEMEEMLDADYCTPGEAAKLRGRLTWASSSMYGKCARGGRAPLVRQQYAATTPRLSQDMRDALHFLQAMVMQVPGREVHLLPAVSQPLVLYSDASWEPREMNFPGLGGVLCGQGPHVRGMAATVPTLVTQDLEERATQIAPLEALAVLQATLCFAQQLHQRDVLLFVDNQAIVAALVRGTSPSPDIARIVSACHLVWAVLGARVWVEWVPTDSNVSDGLSRAGTRDKWTCSQGWCLRDVTCIPWHAFQKLQLIDLPKALLHWALTLG